ncbi:hypothetical protein EOL70_15390 [Leucothrix sargassi]|nr:hypothetical protein EOL70_15390 [Leucothrix sargassi]
MKKIIRKKRFNLPVLLITILALGSFIVVHATHGKSDAVQIVSLDNAPLTTASEQVKVMTVNMAHGRGDGFSQIIQDNDEIKSNVTRIGNLIAKENAQVVALQEADAPSWWSGNFSHVNAVGKLGGMSSAVQGLNVNGLGLGYGTALVTQLKASNARQLTFEKNFPTLSKGLVVVTCEWPGDASFKFDVVSLHLDFANSSVREEQLAALKKLIKTSDRPVVVMGDFNTDMSEALLPTFVKDTGLSAWKIDDPSIITFPLMSTRIDWIFVSPQLQIVEQTVLDEVLSDHKIVTAVIERTQANHAL